MSALEDLKTLRDAVRKELPAIKSLMACIESSQGVRIVDYDVSLTAATKAVDNLQRLVQTDSGNISISVPSGRLGAKGQ